MDKYESLLSELKQIDDSIDALLLSTDALTADQKAEHDGLVSQRERKVSEIAKEKDRRARAAERAKLAAEAEEAKVEAAEQAAKTKLAAERTKRQELAGTGRVTSPEAGTPPPVQRNTIPASARRHGKLRNFKGVKDGFTADERAFRFGMWNLALASRQLPGRYNFQAAIDYTDRHITAHGETGTTGFHNVVPDEFMNDLIDLREQYGIARQIFRVVNMESDSVLRPRRTGGLTVYAIAENAVVTESNMTLGDIRLTAKKWGAIARWSNELNADAVIDMADTLAGEMSWAFANKEDDCAFNGDGTSTYQGVRGVRDMLDNASGTTDSAGLFTALGGNGYNELLLADFNSVVSLLPQYAFTPNVCWVCSTTFWAAAMQRLETAAGGTQPADIVNGILVPKFLGFPVKFAQVMPVTAASSQVACLFGDFSLGAMIGLRGGVEIAYSNDAYINSESVFERDQLAIRGITRFDINVHDAGSTSVAGPIVGLKMASS